MQEVRGFSVDALGYSPLGPPAFVCTHMTQTTPDISGKPEHIFIVFSSAVSLKPKNHSALAYMQLPDNHLRKHGSTQEYITIDWIRTIHQINISATTVMLTWPQIVL